MLDEWTNVFFSPGTRTTGNSKQDFAIVGPNWNGSVPDGIKTIKSPTDIIWVIGRIQTNGKSDYAAVNKLQDQFKLTTLSQWLNKDSSSIQNSPQVQNSSVDTKTSPIEQVLNMDGITFFKTLANLLKTTQIPDQDKQYVQKFAAIGLIPGQDFQENKISSLELNQIIKETQKSIINGWRQNPNAKNVNGWTLIDKDIGAYGVNYFLRAAVAYGGLGANLPQDALYPATEVDDKGQPLNGRNNYLIHFEKGQLPPVNAFWSITMYNDKHLFIANPINRFAIGDRDQLKTNSDGSVDIYLQNLSPGQDKESNWLPSPTGNFNLILRLYYPKEAILNGEWQPPKVQKIN
jgi:hypothetical protein